jgi:hypothetical protein
MICSKPTGTSIIASGKAALISASKFIAFSWEYIPGGQGCSLLHQGFSATNTVNTDQPRRWKAEYRADT